ncbi:aminotransferase class V-fold PLP-dependent enzyme [Salibacteraceae bacterium]|nr:aminotransferase class V-fold PLP-dependent enzyme [Salibacteraceae bacterium]
MQNQKHLVHLKEGIHYLNCAAKSPLLIKGEAAMIEAMDREKNLHLRTANDFFDRPETGRKLFASLVDCEPKQVAFMPAVSYGLSSVLKNVSYSQGQHAITIESEFPSDYLALESWSRKHGASINVIGPNNSKQPFSDWNERIIDAISDHTAVVAISAIHWMNGYKYDLKAIGERCKERGAIFIVDGTQAVGAMKIDVKAFNIDALICAGYKWLFGPYSIGCFYMSERFNEGTPIEESWMNRTNANKFSELINYGMTYTDGAGRYNVGETSNFLLMPVFLEGMKQVIEWGPENITEYCTNLAIPLHNHLKAKGLDVDQSLFASHLFSISLPVNVNPNDYAQTLADRNIYVSARGSGVRVSLNVFNTEEDVDVLIETLS